MSRAIQVTVVDLDTNESETKQIDGGDFLLITTEPCWLASTQRYPMKGTTVLTVKNHHPKLEPNDPGPIPTEPEINEPRPPRPFR